MTACEVSDGFEVAAVADLHWSGRGEVRLPDLSDVDLTVLAGDLTNYGDDAAVKRLLTPFLLAAPRLLAVCGNTDRVEHEQVLEEVGIALDRKALHVGPVRFVGLSGALPFGGCPYERSEEDFAEACRQAGEALAGVDGSAPTVLVSHQPPYGTRCDWTRGRHTGSRAVRAFVEELQPDLVLTGHIHECRGEDVIGRSRIVNPGPWMRGHHVRFAVVGGTIGPMSFL